MALINLQRDKLLIIWTILVIALLSWMRYGPIWPPFRAIENADEFALYARDSNGATLTVQRAMDIDKPLHIRIDRELLGQIDGKSAKWALPSTETDWKKKGPQVGMRVLPVQPLKRGTYILTNSICYDANPIREHCVPLSPLTVEVR